MYQKLNNEYEKHEKKLAHDAKIDALKASNEELTLPDRITEVLDARREKGKEEREKAWEAK